MKSKNLKSAIWLILAAGAVTLAGGGAAFGKGPPPGKGNKPPTEVGNSLSVPAFIVGAQATPFENLTCVGSWDGAALTRVTGATVEYEGGCADTVEGDGDPYCMAQGDYFVQRVNPWQAPCVLGESAQATASWGDNMVGDASMKVGSPIRVELVLWDSSGESAGQQGYYVIKLQPDELDRNSAYGHLADPITGLDIPRVVGSLVSNPFGVLLNEAGDFPPEPTFGAIVHDAEAHLNIVLLNADLTPAETVFDGDAGAEINATGKIVYGHNLRVGVPGNYRITYTLPNVTLTGIGNVAPVKVPVIQVNDEGDWETYLDIVVSGGGGGKKTRETITATERIRLQEQDQLHVQEQDGAQ